MDYNRRSSSRSVSPRRDSRNRYGRRSSPHERVHRDRRNPERRDDRGFRRQRYERHPERENPQESNCLGVFGMSPYTTEEDLRVIFSAYGPIEKIFMVYDTNTNHSRGYSFIYYETVEDAKEARIHCNNLEMNGKKIRVDFSVTQRAHSPTPGMYMGRRGVPRSSGRDRRGGDDNESRYDGGHRRDDRRDSYRRDERTERTYSRYQRRSRSPRR